MTYGFVRAAAVCSVVLATGAHAGAETVRPVTPVAMPPADPAPPDVASLLFSKPQWGRAPVGSVITYGFTKKTPDSSFGPSFEDHITLDLSSGDDAARRTAAVRMYSGPNALPAGPFKSVLQNPVLLLVFEENVQELSKSFHANPLYLKKAIRKAWRDNPKIEPAQIDVNGKMVAGTRVTVQPFLGDPRAGDMKGLDSMVYSVEVADSVPGTIAAIDIHSPAEGSRTFSETLHYSAMTTP